MSSLSSGKGYPSSLCVHSGAEADFAEAISVKIALRAYSLACSALVCREAYCYKALEAEVTLERLAERLVVGAGIRAIDEIVRAHQTD